MNCGRSSSVEWKLPKLQRRVRFPSPAPPPPGYAPGGFVMPPRQARLASHALFYLPLAPLTQPYGRAPGTKLPQHAALAGRTGTKLSQLAAQRATPVQNSPSSQPSGRHRYKTLPAPPKWPISARFTPAGRTLYRLRHQQTEQGELCTARGDDAGTKLSPLAALAGRTGTKLPQHPQNGPFQHVLRQQGELYTACATNKPSREKKVPHQHPTSPTNAPLPQFRMQFYCMNFQQSPETLQSQRHEFKI